MKLLGTILALAVFASIAFAGSYPVVPANYIALAADTYRVASAPGDVACGPTSSADWTYAGAKMISIWSNGSAIFGGPGDVMTGDYTFDKVLFDPIGRTYGNEEILNGNYSQTPNTTLWKPRVFWKLAGRDCYNWNYFPSDQFVRISALGQNGSLNAHLPGSSNIGAAIYVTEYAGPVPPHPVLGSMSGYEWTAVKYIADNPAYPTLRFKNSDTETSTIWHYNPATAEYPQYELPFTTERGSKFLGMGTDYVSLMLATAIAEPEFRFTQAGSSATHSFKTLITDTIDRTPKNRNFNLSEDKQTTGLGAADTGGIFTSPLRGVEDGLKGQLLYMIGSAQFAGFANYAAIDGTTSYTEEQNFWAGSQPNAVAYDSSIAIRDVAVNKYSAMAYSAKFSGNDYGIPVCTGGLGIAGDYTSCAGQTYRTDAHRVKIRFFGADWIISSLYGPNATSLPSSVAAIKGGMLMLAKESAYGSLAVGQAITNGYFKVSPAYFYSDGSVAYNIYNPSGIVGANVSVPQGQTFTFTESGTGKVLKFHLYKVTSSAAVEFAVAPVPGESAIAPITKKADTAIYSDEIRLVDNQRYNLVSATSPDKDFKVSLLWKNRDYSSSNSNTVPDSLREVVVYNVDGFTDKTRKGDAFSFLKSNATFQLTYLGIEPVVCAKPPSCPKGTKASAYTDANGCPAVSCIPLVEVPPVEAVTSGSVPEKMLLEPAKPVAKPAQQIAGSIADTSGDMYAKLMILLGVYVQDAKRQ